jgi:hypothetical protein
LSILRAEFQMIDKIPVRVQGDKHTHYSIKLSIPDAPQDAITIIYVLDSSYKNPVRLITKGVPDFQEYITAYGDYEIRVLYRPASDPNGLAQLLATPLSNALIQTYGETADPEIRAAIKAISDN